MKKIIYDLGANEGQNIPYYFHKSDLVVAVEANPYLCNLLKKKFEKQILEKKLIVENLVVTNNESFVESFYISKFGSQFSTCRPEKNVLQIRDKTITKDDYLEKLINSINILDLLKKHGHPHYIKIDLEHFDEIILNEILEKCINKPLYISSECQDIKVYDILIRSNEYQSFKYVLGSKVGDNYSNHKFKDINNFEQVFNFKKHSAGPFGDDILGNWLSKDEFKNKFLELSDHELAPGWIDIHAKLKN